jgi:hypothetical protein
MMQRRDVSEPAASTPVATTPEPEDPLDGDPLDGDPPDALNTGAVDALAAPADCCALPLGCEPLATAAPTPGAAPVSLADVCDAPSVVPILTPSTRRSRPPLGADHAPEHRCPNVCYKRACERSDRSTSNPCPVRPAL